jgi:hypothetical protein
MFEKIEEKHYFPSHSSQPVYSHTKQDKDTVLFKEKLRMHMNYKERYKNIK